MAIVMRRGQYGDFDKGKMLPGEWAVVLADDPTARDGKTVYICFSAGVVKRIGTYEDFKDMILDLTNDIREEYIAAFDEIEERINAVAAQVDEDKQTVIVIRDTIINTYIPQMEGYVAAAERSKENAATSEKNAKDSENAAEDWSLWSKSYAIGEGGKRPGEETDNSKYYYEQALRISQGLEGALLPMGTIEFAKLSTVAKSAGYMYNISDEFDSDSTFEDGGGKHYGAGSNVYYTVGGKWDVMAPNGVVGIKGTEEVIYRNGLVELSAENVGAVPEGGDTAENIVTFDDADPSGETGFPAIENITSGEKHKSIFAKLRVWGRGISKLITLLGSTDISEIGDGTVTSALATLMADKLNKTDIVNALLSTAEDKALSAAMGKQLGDAVSKLNTDTAAAGKLTTLFSSEQVIIGTQYSLKESYRNYKFFFAEVFWTLSAGTQYVKWIDDNNNGLVFTTAAIISNTSSTIACAQLLFPNNDATKFKVDYVRRLEFGNGAVSFREFKTGETTQLVLYGGK